jgi:adenine-specific DNA methylase
MTHHKRLIELSIPLDAISVQSAREKSIRHGHISTLHIWWARRPLAACRAAVLAALVDAPEPSSLQGGGDRGGAGAERERLEHLIAPSWTGTRSRTATPPLSRRANGSSGSTGARRRPACSICSLAAGRSSEGRRRRLMSSE